VRNATQAARRGSEAAHVGSALPDFAVRAAAKLPNGASPEQNLKQQPLAAGRGRAPCYGGCSSAPQVST